MKRSQQNTTLDKLKSLLKIEHGEGKSLVYFLVVFAILGIGSAIVIQSATVLKLSQPKLRGLIMSYPELGLGMLKSVSLKLRKTSLMLQK